MEKYIKFMTHKLSPQEVLDKHAHKHRHLFIRVITIGLLPVGGALKTEVSKDKIAESRKTRSRDLDSEPVRDGVPKYDIMYISSH